MLRLTSAAGADDVSAWLTRRIASAPGVAFGGITDRAPGGSVVLQGPFPPGRYALICWVADARDGRPHWQHGMIRVIDVR